MRWWSTGADPAGHPPPPPPPSPPRPPTPTHLLCRQVVLNEMVIDRGISPFLTNLETFCDGNFVTHVQASAQPLGPPPHPLTQPAWTTCLHGFACMGLPARTCLRGPACTVFACTGLPARACLHGPACTDLHAWACLHGPACMGLPAKTCMHA